MSDVKNILYVTPDQNLDEIIEGCVAETWTLLEALLISADPSITGIGFRSGHPLEIIKEIASAMKGVTTKAGNFPAVWLFHDWPEVNGAIPGIENQSNINLIVANRTDQNYNTSQRTAKNFRPILEPIASELLHQFEMTGKFMTLGEGQQNSTGIKHYFWGKAGIYGSAENIFLDWIDCIEFKNLNLKIYDDGR